MAIFSVLFQVPFSCAQRGTPSGGPKDTIPPTFMSSNPEPYTTHFDSEIIHIDFDEYITLEEPSKQILISPPLEKKPTITPQVQPLKYVEIEFEDTLAPNTTYSINFGKSIQDNNEGNALPFYKYVFSTGDYIDSLSVSGKVTDAFNRETEESISVMLYPLDTTYSDSVIYQTPPKYIAYTRDSTNVFSIENAEEGAYKIVAIQDKNQNYLFNSSSEKIGFLTDTIHLPTDKEYHLNIFKEIRDYKPKRPQQISLQHFLFPIEGQADSVKIRLLSDKPEDFKEEAYKRVDKDSIDYWFNPAFDVEETDSLVFEVRKGSQRDTVVSNYKEADIDSLQLSADPSSNIAITGNFELSANTPLTKIDTSFIQILDKDSLQVPFKTTYRSEGNKYIFDFEKKAKNNYYIKALPGALIDFYGTQNDTLAYTLSTKPKRAYADLVLEVKNIAQYPVIVQLTDKNGESKRELIHHKEDGSTFHFDFVSPGKYYVRLIYDSNDNGIWDTGNYLHKRQPEEVIYMKELLDIRKNWEISQTFILNKSKK